MGADAAAPVPPLPPPALPAVGSNSELLPAPLHVPWDPAMLMWDPTLLTAAPIAAAAAMPTIAAAGGDGGQQLLLGGSGQSSAALTSLDGASTSAQPLVSTFGPPQPSVAMSVDAGGGGSSGGGPASPRAGAATGGKAPACQVCYADLSGLKAYYARYKICPTHCVMPALVRDGGTVRFCQQVGVVA